MRGADSTPRAGVVACLPKATAEFARERGYLGPGTCPGGVRSLGKMVLAMAGDTVAYGNEGISVNGTPIARSRALSRDSQGRPIRHYPWGWYVLPLRQLWLFSPYRANSYDSRYFGPVGRSEVGRVVEPVWTWGQ